MAHKRNRRHRRKQQSATAARTPVPGQDGVALCEQGWGRLEAGDARGALECFRALQKVDEAAAQLPLYCACQGRARQLRGKGLVREAAAMAGNGEAHWRRFDVAGLTGDDWPRFLRYAPVREAVPAYVAAVARGAGVAEVAGAPAEADLAAADRVVVGRCWEQLEALQVDHPLRRDAGPVRQAVSHMDAGDWQGADRELAPVPRRSPYAPWRLLCKAMACRAAGDEAGASRALAGLPPHFILRSAAMRGTGDTGPLAARQVTALAAAIRQRHVRDLERLLAQVGDALLPGDGAAGRVALLEIAAAQWRRGDGPPPSVQRLLRGVLPARRGQALALRLDLLAEAELQALPALEVTDYLKEGLVTEFPDETQRRLASSQVLQLVARCALENPRAAIWLDDEDRQLLEGLVADGRLRGVLVFAGLAQRAVDLDPQDRAARDLLIECLRRARAKRRDLEAALEATAQRFADDPAPCLQLARLHLGNRNAYRKAQEALARARERAPQDPGVLDLEAVIRLRAAIQGRRRGNLERARADHCEAMRLRRPRLAPLVEVEGMVLELCDPQDGGERAVAHQLAGLPPAAALRAAAALCLCSAATNAPAQVYQAADRLLVAHADAVGTLDGEEVVRLCAALPSEARLLWQTDNVVVVLTRWWDSLLQRVGDAGLPPLVARLLGAEGGLEAAHAELERRLVAVVDGEGDAVLCFLRLVLRWMCGQLSVSRAFAKIHDGADEGTRQRLRQVAASLAPHTHGYGREALITFDIEDLELLLDRTPMRTPASPPGRGDRSPVGRVVAPAAMEEDDENDEESPLDRYTQADLFPEAPGSPRASRRGPGAARPGRGAIDPDSDKAAAVWGHFRADAGPLPDPDDVAPEDALFAIEGMVDATDLRGVPDAMLRILAMAVRQEEPEMARALEILGQASEPLWWRLSREARTLLFPDGRVGPAVTGRGRPGRRRKR